MIEGLAKTRVLDALEEIKKYPLDVQATGLASDFFMILDEAIKEFPIMSHDEIQALANMSNLEVLIFFRDLEQRRANWFKKWLK